MSDLEEILDRSFSVIAMSVFSRVIFGIRIKQLGAR